MQALSFFREKNYKNSEGEKGKAPVFKFSNSFEYCDTQGVRITSSTDKKEKPFRKMVSIFLFFDEKLHY